MNARVDEGAEAADRHPSAIRRVYNVDGTITDGARNGFLDGPVEHWVDELTDLATTHRMDAFVFWPEHDDDTQWHRFVEEVAPDVRAAVG